MRVLFDVDGVIGDFTQLFVSAVIALGLRPITHAWRPTQWDLAKDLKLTSKEEGKVYGILNQPGIMLTEGVLPGAVEGVKRVMKVAEVFFVTSPTEGNPTWAHERRQWLTKLFGADASRNLVITSEKYVVFGHYLVDDRYDNCVKWADAWRSTGVAVHWLSRGQQHQQRMGIMPCHDWDYLCTLLEARAKYMNELQDAFSRA